MGKEFPGLLKRKTFVRPGFIAAFKVNWHTEAVFFLHTEGEKKKEGRREAHSPRLADSVAGSMPEVWLFSL